MERVIIGVTFFFGAALVIVGAIALFGKRPAAGGSLNLPGIKLTANSAPALFLVIGAAMMLSGFAWASTDRQRASAVTAKNQAVEEKTQTVREAANLHEAYVKQMDLSRVLAERANPAVVNELPPDKRATLTAPAVTLSPKLRAEIAKLPSR